LRKSERKKEFQELDEELLNYTEELTGLIKELTHKMLLYIFPQKALTKFAHRSQKKASAKEFLKNKPVTAAATKPKNIIIKCCPICLKHALSVKSSHKQPQKPACLP
jgi:hypothetical protein